MPSELSSQALADKWPQSTSVTVSCVSRSFAARFSPEAKSKVPSSYTSACMHLLHHWLALRRHFKATSPISAASANETANRKHHHTVKCAASVILGRGCEWKCNIAVARLFSSDTTTLQSPRLSRLIRPCLIDSPSILKKVEHAILGVHLQHDTPDTDDSQHTPPPGGTFMPQSRPQHSHLHDSMQFVKKSRPSAQPRWNSSLP